MTSLMQCCHFIILDPINRYTNQYKLNNFYRTNKHMFYIFELFVRRDIQCTAGCQDNYMLIAFYNNKLIQNRSLLVTISQSVNQSIIVFLFNATFNQLKYSIDGRLLKTSIFNHVSSRFIGPRLL